jgi:hypothetical protein
MQSDGGCVCLSCVSRAQSYLTTFPTISAAGDKLRLCAIIKGKTRRCLKKITEHASADVKKVKLYFTERGKMNTVTMLAWLQDIVFSYSEGRPVALLLDAYASHFAYDVQCLADDLHIQIIRVPHGLTATLQPLDVQFNGPMLALRKKNRREVKIADPLASDSWQRAIERAQQSYAAMSPAATRAAWIAAHLVD